MSKRKEAHLAWISLHSVSLPNITPAGTGLIVPAALLALAGLMGIPPARPDETGDIGALPFP
jgi:hypothetical protein